MFYDGGQRKITIDLGPVDLGRIDLLVQEGFYANRSDFIRTAIRNQLVAEREPLSRSIERHGLDLGLREITRHELETAIKNTEPCTSAWSASPASRRT